MNTNQVQDIINVIETSSGLVDSINSFVILTSHTPQQQQKIIKEAEFFFVELVKKNTIGAPLSKGEIEDTISEGFFDDQAGYEVLIVWSHRIEELALASDKNGTSTSHISIKSK